MAYEAPITDIVKLLTKGGELRWLIDKPDEFKNLSGCSLRQTCPTELLRFGHPKEWNPIYRELVANFLSEAKLRGYSVFTVTQSEYNEKPHPNVLEKKDKKVGNIDSTTCTSPASYERGRKNHWTKWRRLNRT